MTDELLKNIKEMYDSFFKEQKEVKEKLNNNLNKLSEIDNYLCALEEKEETDFRVFSPRSASVLYKEEIEKGKEEKKKIEEDNLILYRSIGKMDSRIRTISSILNIFESTILTDSSFSNDETDDDKLDVTELGKEDIIGKLRVLDIQEKERQRIARDLHDTSLQNLTHIVHKIEFSSMYIDQDPVKAKLELALVNKNLKSVIQEIRDTIFDMRPMTFDDLGLKESFGRLIDKMKESSGIDIELEIEEINCHNPLILMTIFRIVEECINNAVKHSQATKICLSLKKLNEEKCIIIVSDDGKGFDIEKIVSEKDKHFGLKILQERVELLSASLKIDSKPGSGTLIRVCVPVLPVLVMITVKLIPKDIFQKYREESKNMWENGKPVKWYYALPIILIWLLVLYFIIRVILFS